MKLIFFCNLLVFGIVNACLPTGFGGGLLGSGGCSGSGRPGGCAAAAAQYSAPVPPAPAYPFSPQLFSQPPPPPPPPPPPAAPARETPIPAVATGSSSSYQGMYQDRPQAPGINPDFTGTAPLSFASSEDAANTVIDPLKYIEHVSVSHTPPVQEAYQEPEPADPFTSIESHKAAPKQQIQVAPSSASTAEDTYLPGPPENSTQFNTYYNQLCAGEKIATGEKETISSASKKCELLKCVAANAQPDSHGSFTVTYLKSATSRSNSKGNYCLSTIDLPAKSKRVIRRFDEMMANEVRKKIFKL